MSESQNLNAPKIEYDAYSVSSATTTGVIDLKGGTLVGIYAGADLTSTTFTITMSPTEDGTYVTVKDPLSSGTAITYTMGSTATGYFPISETTTKGIRFMKIVFGSTETGTIYVARKVTR